MVDHARLHRGHPGHHFFVSLICNRDHSDRGDCRDCSDSDDTNGSSPLPFPSFFPADVRRDSGGIIRGGIDDSSPSPFSAVPCGRGDRDDPPLPVVAPARGIDGTSPSPTPAGPCGRGDGDGPPLSVVAPACGSSLTAAASVKLSMSCVLPSLRGAIIELDDPSCIAVMPGRS